MLKVSQLRAQTAKYADALIFNSAGFFLLVSLVLYALKPSIAMVPTKYDKVVLFGDSLTQVKPIHLCVCVPERAPCLSDGPWRAMLRS